MKAEAKFKSKELYTRFIEGVRGGEWEDAITFWRKVLKPAGCPPQRYRYLREHGDWDSQARMIVGQRNLAVAQKTAATEYQKLANAYAQASVLAEALFQDVVRIRSKPDLSAGEVDKLMNSVKKGQEILQEAMLDPKDRGKDGNMVVNIQFNDEAPPYAKPVLGGDIPVITAVDEAGNNAPSEASGGERGEKDTEDRPVLQVAPIQDADQPVQGGGVVYSPVQDAGQDGSVAEAVATVGGTAEETDRGKDQ